MRRSDFFFSKVSPYPKDNVFFLSKFSSFIFITIFLFSGFQDSFGQKSRSELEKEKKENFKKIEETKKILEETKEKKSTTLGQLSALNAQISTRQRIINTYEREISLLNADIEKTEIVINAMQEDLGRLKKEYGDMIYAAYKAHNNLDKISFIFSARSFNELFLRYQYMRQFSTARKKQVEAINKVKFTLDMEINELHLKKGEKNNLLQDQVVENTNLVVLKEEQTVVVKQLTSKEKELKSELEEKQKAVQKLEKLISDILKKEMERAMAERAAAERKAKTTISATPEVTMISTSFAANKSKLLWPVQKGFVAAHFGKQPHPVLKNVMIENLGVDIQTPKDESVRVVFDGKVTAVANVPGMNTVVMVQHGEYFTVYAKLRSETVTVTPGQKIKAKDHLGQVYTDKDDVSELQFQIWKNSEKQDPEAWLANR
jgi:septal ring factor EnvC (AmiA/AmiB activator)